MADDLELGQVVHLLRVGKHHRHVEVDADQTSSGWLVPSVAVIIEPQSPPWAANRS